MPGDNAARVLGPLFDRRVEAGLVVRGERGVVSPFALHYANRGALCDPSLGLTPFVLPWDLEDCRNKTDGSLQSADQIELEQVSHRSS